MSAVATLHAGMHRQGPGAAEDVAWAVRQAGLAGPVRILDAGCGPGADLETFSNLLPQAALFGVDGLPHLVAEAQARLGDRAQVRVGDMARPGGPWDMIWSAGAVYFLGVTEALMLWRGALGRGGCVAFSEPVLPEGPNDVARAFWADYPAITDGAGLTARIAAADYRILGQRDVIGAAWAGYMDALEARALSLRPGADADLTALLDAALREVDTWRSAPGQILYRLSVVYPDE